MNLRTRHLLSLSLALCPGLAHADVATLWASAKTATTGATGLVGDRWDGPFGYGVAAGAEFVGIDVFGEALMFGTDQNYFTGNVGLDLTFGDDLRFGLGVFTGPLVYVLPEPSTPSGFDVNAIPAGTRNTLEMAGVSLDQANQEYRAIAKDEEAANRTLFGWNGRARLTLEYAVLPILFLGAEGGAGYHYVLSGEAATAAGKKKLVQSQKAANPSVPDQAWEDLSVALGADQKDDSPKTGINWDAGVFLKVEL